MATAPYGVRLFMGVATIAVEETLKLPKTLLMYPMTLASQAAHLVMVLQQNLAELAIKGDSTLETLFPPSEEQPEWATFDEDADDPPGAEADGLNGERRTDGRFALYSTAENAPADAAATPEPAADAAAPPVVDELNYPALTLAQLRARLRSLSVEELQALLGYEEATKGRAPFQTLLANRITSATAK